MNALRRLIRCAQIDTFCAYHDMHIANHEEHGLSIGLSMDAPETIPAGSVRLYDITREPFVAARVIYRDLL